jgi:putative transcriptional regulator
MSTENIPTLVKSLRQCFNMTQEQFAQKIGVSFSTVNQWENGRRCPQPFLLRRLMELREKSARSSSG